ncbi:MAG TPA: hypothetical protein VFM56_15490, partial [Solimonas sp.]|nr:hypothetical protein [Solimonas sp.]
MLAIVAFAALSGCGKSSPVGDSDSERAAKPETRYDLANHCYVLKAADKGYIWRNADGYAATAPDAEAAERFYMKPTALGRYLFYSADALILTAGDGAVSGATAPVDGSDWTVDTPARGEYTAVATSDDNLALALDTTGKLVMASTPGTFTFEPASGCTAYPEIPDDVVGQTYKGRGVDKPVVGFAEVHTHMAMGNEMSDGTHPVGPSAGGVLYGQMFNRFGAPVALDDCEVEHGPNGILDPEALVLDFTPLKQHDTKGWPTFIDWPAYDSQLHQAMYYTWVERAYKAGLRIMVSEGTNINALCELAKTLETTHNPAALGYECNDMKLGIAQVKYLYQLQDYVDAQEGGPGKGWFRIVSTPAEARKVINDGKLAVVPGLEF